MTNRVWDSKLQEWLYPGCWRLIDSAPKDGRFILVAYTPHRSKKSRKSTPIHDKWRYAVAVWNDMNGWLDYPMWTKRAPEFWMPLPLPPEG